MVDHRARITRTEGTPPGRDLFRERPGSLRLERAREFKFLSDTNPLGMTTSS